MGYSANVSPHGSGVPNQNYNVCTGKGSQEKLQKPIETDGFSSGVFYFPNCIKTSDLELESKSKKLKNDCTG